MVLGIIWAVYAMEVTAITSEVTVHEGEFDETITEKSPATLAANLLLSAPTVTPSFFQV